MLPPMTSDPHVHHTRIQMRFADTDALGHVNNGSFVVYVESGRLEFFRDLGCEVRSLILAHLAVDFRRQVTFGQAVGVDTWVEKVGRTSVTLRQNVLADGVVAAETRSVVVCFDYATQKPAPWSEVVREAFGAYVRQGTG